MRALLQCRETCSGLSRTIDQDNRELWMCVRIGEMPSLQNRPKPLTNDKPLLPSSSDDDDDNDAMEQQEQAGKLVMRLAARVGSWIEILILGRKLRIPAKSLENFVNKATRLRQVNFSSCDIISDELIGEMARSCRMLERVELMG